VLGAAEPVELKFHSLEIPLEGLELPEGMRPALARMEHRFFQILALELDLAQEWLALPVLHPESWPVGLGLPQEQEQQVQEPVLVPVSLVGVADLACYRTLRF